MKLKLWTFGLSIYPLQNTEPSYSLNVKQHVLLTADRDSVILVETSSS